MNARASEASRLAAPQNMSAPPRSTVDIRPLRGAVAGTQIARGWGGQAASTSSGPSAEFFARVHLPGLLADGRSHVPRGVDIARGVEGGLPDLADALAMLRTGRKTGKALELERAACRALSFPRLQDEFLERIAALE